MIAHRVVDGEGASGEGVGKRAIAFHIAPVGKIASRQQQVRTVRAFDQGVKNLVQALPVQLSRIARVEAEMNIRDLCDQHGFWFPPLFSRRGRFCAAGLPGLF